MSTSVTSEMRIEELNQVDHNVAEFLALMSEAVGLLPSKDFDAAHPILDDRKTEFRAIGAQVAAKLSAIEVHVRRSADGLEEAGRLPKGTKYDADKATSMSEDQTSKRDGGGPLDSTWLNARAKDTTGRDLKREVLDDAIDFLKHSKIISSDSSNKMQVDSKID